jgi:heme o synthase
VNPATSLDRVDESRETALPESSLAVAFSELTKVRLTAMVLLTTLTGYFLASRGVFEWRRLFHTLLGTALVAICASILNQALEKKTDALMRRTEQRPFVTRRLPLAPTVWAGLFLGAIGLAELARYVNGLSALVAAITLGTYVVIYTPIKKLTVLNTLVGAIPGALPPLLGATAARGHLCVEGWTLFSLLACWQLPHFYAIAWLYRDDYRAAGLRMVSVNDLSGRWTAFHAVATCLLLLPVSLLPVWFGTSGFLYGVIALVLWTGFMALAVRFARNPVRPSARALFLASIVYLPLVLIALVADEAMRRG